MLYKYVRKIDTVSKEEHHGNLIGGLVSLVGYVLVIIYLVLYITTEGSKPFPINTSVAQFPLTEPTAETLPNINCVAINGCYIQPMGGNVGNLGCVYLQQGESLPAAYKKFYYLPDPTEMWSVLSTDSGQNFAISFDFEKVVGYKNPLETSSSTAVIDFSMTIPRSMLYKVYKGMNTFNLIKTIGVDGEEVNTWTAQLTNTENSFKGSGFCCNSDIYDVNGAAMSSLSCSNSNPNDWWVTYLVPPATYNEVDVLNPLDPFTILGLIGGWVGVVMAALAVVYHLLTDFGLISHESVLMRTDLDDDVKAPGNYEMTGEV